MKYISVMALDIHRNENRHTVLFDLLPPSLKLVRSARCWKSWSTMMSLPSRTARRSRPAWSRWTEVEVSGQRTSCRISA